MSKRKHRNPPRRANGQFRKRRKSLKSKIKQTIRRVRRARRSIRKALAGI